MKNLISSLVLLVTIGCSSISVHAADPGYKQRNQVLDNFMLSMFENAIKDAVSNYYKEDVGTPDTINYVYDFTNKNYDVVEVLQHEPGRKLEYSYIVKFTILPQKKGAGQLGIDTITFGVEPGNTKQVQHEIKMLKFKHVPVNKR